MVNLQSNGGIMGESKQCFNTVPTQANSLYRRPSVPDRDSTTPRKRDHKKAYWDLKADSKKYAAYLERKRKQRLARNVNPDYERERKRKWRAANPAKDRMHHDAHHAVELAVKAGKLIRPKACELCMAGGKIEAHHHLGYEQAHWLDVQWLCQMCHAKQHREIRRKEDTYGRTIEANC